MMSMSSALAAVLILAAPLAGIAQATQNTHKQPPNEHGLNLPGATTIDAPQAGFDPIAASGQDLAFHGSPPRPNPAADPKAYALWAKAMKASKAAGAEPARPKEEPARHLANKTHQLWSG